MFYRRPVCRLNKQGAWLKLDVGEFVEQKKVIEVEMLRHQRSVLPRNNGETHSHLTRACVEHNAERRKTDAALCKSKHNAALLHNPNQGVITTVQEDENDTKDGDYTLVLCVTLQGDLGYLLEEDGLKHINTQIQRHSERQGRTLDSMIATAASMSKLESRH